MPLKLSLAAAICTALFAALGWYVMHQPLSRLDVEGATLRGTAQPLAVAFTLSGYPLTLTVLSVITVVVAILMRVSIAVPLGIALSQTLSQGVVNVAKELYRRARPDDWLYRHELGFSYPSGHATTAIVFYGAWLVVLAASPLPMRTRFAGGIVIGCWMLGIMWSRIALSAHYPTDVIGGTLLGAAWLCALLAIVLAFAPSLLFEHS